MGYILTFVGGIYAASCVSEFAGAEAGKAALMAIWVIGFVIEYAAQRILDAIKASSKLAPQASTPVPSTEPRRLVTGFSLGTGAGPND